MVGSNTQLRQPARKSAIESPNWRIVATAVRLASVLALVRGLAAGKDIFVAQCFGAGQDMDAFLIALSIPNYLTTVLGGSLASAFLPRYVSVQETQGRSAASRMLGSSLIGAAAVLVLAAVGLGSASSLTIPLLGSDSICC
jgi:putative peptidoglycan lipid II flippase